MKKTSFIKKVLVLTSAFCLFLTSMTSAPCFATDVNAKNELRNQVKELLLARDASTTPEGKKAIERALESKLIIQNTHVDIRVIFNEAGIALLMKANDAEGAQEISELREKLRSGVGEYQSRHRSEGETYKDIDDDDDGFWSFVTYVVAYATGGVIGVVVEIILDELDIQAKDLVEGVMA